MCLVRLGFCVYEAEDNVMISLHLERIPLES